VKIAISGAYRSGKDYLGSRISKFTGIPTFALADRVKAIAAERHPALKNDIYAEEKTPETRVVLWNIAREFEQNYWLSFVPTGSVIITDLRLRHELNWVRANGFKIIFIGDNSDGYALDVIKERADLVLPHRPDIRIPDLLDILKN
jgi:hypothetical protein